MHTVVFWLTILSAAPQPADVAVVCPATFREALKPWVEHRQRQGHHLAFVSNDQTVGAIRKQVRDIAKSGKLRFLLLVGDTHPSADRIEELRARSIPTQFVRAKVNIHWGSEPVIASDNWYADLDDDSLPDLAVGRLTADTPDELTTMIRKIIKYEREADFGPWRRRVNFVAGVGGFGQVADTVLELATKKLLGDGVPTAFNTSMTYGSWQSPYCPDPRKFHDATLQRFNEGCLFWVYIGHGQRRYLDQIHVPGARYHILDTDNVDKMQPAQGMPIAIFLACYTGAFDESRDCLAEEMLRAPGGPVAVLCGSRVTMPYAMAVMSNEMMDEYFVRRRETLGEVVLNAKRRMVKSTREAASTNRQLVDMIAKLISPSPKLLDAERAEHLWLFNLLGDPLLRLAHPKKVDVQVAESQHAGEKLTVKATSSLPGQCMIELVCDRQRLRFSPPARRAFDASDRALAAYDKTYERANDIRWTSRSLRIGNGEFQSTVEIPKAAFGPCHVRVFVESDDDFAMGSADVLIRRPQSKSK